MSSPASEGLEEAYIPETFVVKRPPTISDNIKWFDKEEFHPDIELVVPGREKPFRLIHAVVIDASIMFAELLSGKENPFAKYDPETHKMEWVCGVCAKDEMYRKCLEKWLRFCYGEQQTFTADEMSAALATLLQLKLKDEKELKEAILRHMIELSADAGIGCQMLVKCAEYEDYSPEDMKAMNRELAVSLFSRANIGKHHDACTEPNCVVDKCLMLLPSRYIEFGAYGKAHSDQSDFSIRMRYINQHSTLSIEEKRAILSHLKAEELGSEEIKMLDDSNILEHATLMNICLGSLKRFEAAIDEWERFDTFHSLATKSSSKSDIKIVPGDGKYCGAVYDPVRNFIISVSYECNKCHDLLLTHVDDGLTVVKENVIPFVSQYHTPVYDGKQYVYFMEDSFDNGGERFGRIDLESFSFDELPHIAGKKFAASFSGCFHDGNVYTIDKEAMLWRYSVADSDWYPCEVKVPTDSKYVYARLLNDPQNKSHYIYLMADSDKTGGLYRIDLDKHEIALVSKPPVPFEDHHEVLYIQLPSNEFIVVAALKGGLWYYYSSKNGSWANIPKDQWKPPKLRYNDYLVFSTRNKSFYYQVENSDAWETVQL